MSQFNVSAALFTAEALSVTEILRDVGNTASVLSLRSYRLFTTLALGYERRGYCFSCRDFSEEIGCVLRVTIHR